MSNTVVTPAEMIGSYVAAMSWAEVTLVSALAVCLIAWLLVPFSLIGMRSRFEDLNQSVRDLAQTTLTETRQTHELLRDLRGGIRDLQLRIEQLEAVAEPLPAATAKPPSKAVHPFDELKRAA